MKIRNPRNGQYDYILSVDSQETIQQKVRLLRSHYPSWASAPLESRINTLQDFATALEKSKEALIEQLSIDTGRRKISQIEYQGAIGIIKGRCYSAPLMLKQQDQRTSVTSPTVTIGQQTIPYPVVGVISPWNFPLLLAMIDAVPALLAGCTVLLKASEVTPRFLDVLESCIKEVPALAQVFQLVRGGAEVGKAVVDHADVICFTGSTATGRKIAVRAAERLIPAFLEMGGKDAAIVLESADLDNAAIGILRSAAGATGQACQSLERIYVHQSVADDLIDALLQNISKVSFNEDYDKGGTMGPLIFEGQAQKIKSQLEDALEKGATILSGGEIQNINGGLWMLPTIVTQVNHDMQLMQEETFGPVIPIMTFETIQQAIELANDSSFGLSGSVFSQDKVLATEVAAQMEAGGISINDASLTNQVFDAEKNSFKESGMYGSRMGAEGLTRFLRKKAFLIQNEKAASIFTQEENAM